MIKIIPAAIALLVAMPSAGYAANCQDQNGRVIFEDTFDDDSGGWTHALGGVEEKFGKSELTLHLHGPYNSWIFFNNTFNAGEGDFCVEMIMPTAAAPDNSLTAGLAFWGADSSNYYALLLSSNDVIALWRLTAGVWARISDLSDAKIKPEPGSIVALRVVAVGNLIVPSVDGMELKKVRAQLPAGNLRFGMHVQSDKALPDAAFVFKRYKVTTGGP